MLYFYKNNSPCITFLIFFYLQTILIYVDQKESMTFSMPINSIQIDKIFLEILTLYYVLPYGHLKMNTVFTFIIPKRMHRDSL